MNWRLYAARYDELDWATTLPKENISNIADVGLRWQLPGGLQRMEVTIRCNSRYEAFGRYRNHLGHVIALYDSACDRYIAGQVYETIMDDRLLTYVCAGPWKRAYDQYYTISDMPTSGDTDAIIKDILTDAVSIDSTDQSNVAATSVAVGGWTPRPDPGSKAADAIESLASMGNSSNAVLDFWFQQARFAKTGITAPIPYMTARSSSWTPEWRFNRRDLARGGYGLSRQIWDLITKPDVGYGRLAGTHTGANGATTITDGGGVNFITSGVTSGDIVYNLTDKNRATITAVAATTLTLANITGGTDNDYDTNDKYVVAMRNPQYATTLSETVNYWSVEHREIRLDLDATQAGEYRDRIKAMYNKAINQKSFVIGSPTITDTNGARWPLWRPIFEGGGYFRIDDMFPEAAVFADSDDRAQTFRVTAMDYTYRDNRLRVVPLSRDARLDAMLAQFNDLNVDNTAGIGRVGPIISTAGSDDGDK